MYAWDWARPRPRKKGLPSFSTVLARARPSLGLTLRAEPLSPSPGSFHLYSIVWSFIIYLSERFSFVLSRKPSSYFDRRLQSRWKCLDKGINLSNNSFFPWWGKSFSKNQTLDAAEAQSASIQNLNSLIHIFVKEIWCSMKTIENRTLHHFVMSK